MKLTEEPEIVNWAETHYVFIEKTGPFMNTAPQAWQELHNNIPELAAKNKIAQYLSLYKAEAGIYRAGEQTGADMVEEDRQEDHEGGAEIIADNAAHAAQDDDEHHFERAIEIEASRVDCAEIGEGPERAGYSAEQRTDEERLELA